MAGYPGTVAVLLGSSLVGTRLRTVAWLLSIHVHVSLLSICGDHITLLVENLNLSWPETKTLFSSPDLVKYNYTYVSFPILTRR